MSRTMLRLAALATFLCAAACSTSSETPIPDNSPAVTAATQRVETVLACPEPLPVLTMCPDSRPALITKAGKLWCPPPAWVVDKVQSAPLKDAAGAALTWALDEQDGRLRVDSEYGKPCREKLRSSSVAPVAAASPQNLP